MQNRRKLRKFNGIVCILVAALLFVLSVLSFCFQIPYMPCRVFLRIPALVVYTVVYLGVFLFMYPSAFGMQTALRYADQKTPKHVAGGDVR